MLSIIKLVHFIYKTVTSSCSSVQFSFNSVSALYC